MDHINFLFRRENSHILGRCGLTFGLGRKNGQRISDLKNYGVDSEPCSLPAAYDNDDVPIFTVDEHVNYNVERRRNVVGPAPSYISRPDPVKDEVVGNTEDSAVNPDASAEG